MNVFKLGFSYTLLIAFCLNIVTTQEDGNVCDPNPCLHDGRCIISEMTYRCECLYENSSNTDINGELNDQQCYPSCTMDHECGSAARCNPATSHCSNECKPEDIIRCSNLNESHRNECLVDNSQIVGRNASFQCSCNRGYAFAAPLEPNNEPQCLRIRCVPECENNYICVLQYDHSFACERCPDGTVSWNKYGISSNTCENQCENHNDCGSIARCDHELKYCTTLCDNIYDRICWGIKYRHSHFYCEIENKTMFNGRLLQKCVCEYGYTLNDNNLCIKNICEPACTDLEACAVQIDGSNACECKNQFVHVEGGNTICRDACYDDFICGPDERCENGSCTKLCKTLDGVFCLSLSHTNLINYCIVVNSKIDGIKASFRCNCIVGYGYAASNEQFSHAECLQLDCSEICGENYGCTLQDDRSFACERCPEGTVSWNRKGYSSDNLCKRKCEGDYFCHSTAKCERETGICSRICDDENIIICSKILNRATENYCVLQNSMRMGEGMGYKCVCKDGYTINDSNICIENICEPACSHLHLCINENGINTCKCKDEYITEDEYGITLCREICYADHNCGHDARCLRGECTKKCKIRSRLRCYRLNETPEINYCSVVNSKTIGNIASYRCNCNKNYAYSAPDAILQKPQCLRIRCSEKCQENYGCTLQDDRSFACKVCPEGTVSWNRYGYPSKVCKEKCEDHHFCGFRARCDFETGICTRTCEIKISSNCLNIINRATENYCIIANSKMAGATLKQKCVCEDGYTMNANDICIENICEPACSHLNVCINNAKGINTCECKDENITEEEGNTVCREKCSSDSDCGRKERCRNNFCTNLCKPVDSDSCNALEHTIDSDSCLVDNPQIVDQSASYKCNCDEGYSFYQYNCLATLCTPPCSGNFYCFIEKDGTHQCGCPEGYVKVNTSGTAVIDGCFERCTFDICTDGAKCNENTGKCTYNSCDATTNPCPVGQNCYSVVNSRNYVCACNEHQLANLNIKGESNGCRAICPTDMDCTSKTKCVSDPEECIDDWCSMLKILRATGVECINLYQWNTNV